eukprot:1513937-Alexandrium_andersonii.AAC.1
MQRPLGRLFASSGWEWPGLGLELASAGSSEGQWALGVSGVPRAASLLSRPPQLAASHSSRVP